MFRIATISAGIAAALVFAGAAEAQATRTWVSGVGDDANPCSRTAPCKTFAGAISKTAAGGEISILDPAGYGAVTINKSISIIAEGSEGSILGAGTNGVVINTGPNDTVLLHGLFIEGGGTGINGIRIINGGQVTIRDALIRGFRTGGAGILVEGAGNTRVVVSDTTIEANTAGIVVRPAAPAGGVVPRSTVLIEDTDVIHNAESGVVADCAGASVSLNRSTVTQNGVGLAAKNGGQIASFGNNVVMGNGQDGAATSKAALQ